MIEQLSHGDPASVIAIAGYHARQPTIDRILERELAFAHDLQQCDRYKGFSYAPGAKVRIERHRLICPELSDAGYRCGDTAVIVNLCKHAGVSNVLQGIDILLQCVGAGLRSRWCSDEWQQARNKTGCGQKMVESFSHLFLQSIGNRLEG